jgi:hypothetical protein
MSSLTPEFLARLRFDANHAATLRALGEYRGKQELFFRQAPEVLKGLRQIAVIESSESSNRLEGVTVPTNRLKALVIKHTKPRDRSEQEVAAGYRDALGLKAVASMCTAARVSDSRNGLRPIVRLSFPTPGRNAEPDPARCL